MKAKTRARLRALVREHDTAQKTVDALVFGIVRATADSERRDLGTPTEHTWHDLIRLAINHRDGAVDELLRVARSIE